MNHKKEPVGNRNPESNRGLVLFKHADARSRPQAHGFLLVCILRVFGVFGVLGFWGFGSGS